MARKTYYDRISSGPTLNSFDVADAAARYQALAQVEIKNRQKADDQRLARALIVADAKANLKPSAYKAFLAKIECADSTSRELLKIAGAGSADDVRRATRLRVADHRARKAAVTVTAEAKAADERYGRALAAVTEPKVTMHFGFNGELHGRNAKRILAVLAGHGVEPIDVHYGVRSDWVAQNDFYVSVHPQDADRLTANLEKAGAKLISTYDAEEVAPSITPKPALDSQTKIPAAEVWSVIQPVLAWDGRVENETAKITDGTLELYDAVVKARDVLHHFEWSLDTDDEISAQIYEREEALRNSRRAELEAARTAYKAAHGHSAGRGDFGKRKALEWYRNKEKAAL
jgi:hypothetical protein